jgi:hypothetical protein
LANAQATTIEITDANSLYKAFGNNVQQVGKDAYKIKEGNKTTEVFFGVAALTARKAEVEQQLIDSAKAANSKGADNDRSAAVLTDSLIARRDELDAQIKAPTTVAKANDAPVTLGGCYRTAALSVSTVPGMTYATATANITIGYQTEFGASPIGRVRYELTAKSSRNGGPVLYSSSGATVPYTGNTPFFDTLSRSAGNTFTPCVSASSFASIEADLNGSVINCSWRGPTLIRTHFHEEQSYTCPGF